MAETGAPVTGFRCAKCERELGVDEAAYTCPICGPEGILDVLYDYDAIAPRISRETLESSRDGSIWRYLPLLPVASRDDAPVLRTGWSPLYDVCGLLDVQNLYIKDDSRNPTASLKDRATAVAMARARSAGVEAVAAASTGNAGCSLAGFAAAEGLACYIFVPATAPRPKVAQLLVYGATVFAVDGSYDDAFDLAMEAIEEFGWYNRCCAVNPFLVEGKKTVSFEIAEQMGFRVPDTVFVPVGDGCIMSGTYKGFAEFARVGLTDRIPRLIGVQAEGCGPVTAAFEGCCELEPTSARTCADSIAVGHPRNWRKALKGVRASEGSMMTVTDDEILSAIVTLARSTGVYGEPAGVTAFAGLVKALREGLVGRRETIAVLMTGSGLKDTESAMRVAGEAVPIGRSLDDVQAAFADGRVRRRAE
jgi:threonine synthase